MEKGLKCALVTGASSGIGKECSRMLLEEGFRVFGIARDFGKCDLTDENFVRIECDLKDANAVFELKKKIPKKDLKVLINNAGIGHFAPHEELSFKKIEEMIDLNLKAPVLLTNLFLRELKKNEGYVFNINSISALKASFFGAVYGATKAGLRHFGISLFEEARKSGLKVTNINPDFTKTPFFDELNFSPDEDPLSYIEPKDIAAIIKEVLNLREGTVVTEITVQPQKFKILKKKAKKRN